VCFTKIFLLFDAAADTPPPPVSHAITPAISSYDYLFHFFFHTLFFHIIAFAFIDDAVFAFHYFRQDYFR